MTYPRSTTLGRNRKTEAGFGFVELAVMLPLIAIILAGVSDYGRAFYETRTLASAVRAGVQYGSQNVENSEDIDGMRLAAVDGIGGATTAAADGLTVTPQQFCECSDGSPIACSNGCGAGLTHRIFVRVRAQKTFDSMFTYLGVPNTLEDEAVMRVQ